MEKAKYTKELQALDQALQQLTSELSELRVNPVKLPEATIHSAAWQVEDAHGNKLFVVLTGGKEASSEHEANMVFSVESEVGQFIDLASQDAKVFLELNYERTTLAKIGMTGDLRLVVLHRRWFEDITTRSILDAVGEVWNTAQNLRESLQPMEPGHA